MNEGEGTCRIGRAHRRGHGKNRRTHGRERIDLANLARFRQIAYRLFATAFAYPDKDQVCVATAIAATLDSQNDALLSFPFFSEWSQLLDRVRALDHCDLKAVEDQYFRCFVIDPELPPCPPYESVHLALPPGASGVLTAQLVNEYRDGGLEISPSLEEAPDHATVELEYMTLLCDQEARAWEKKHLKEGIEALKRQQSFLKQHLSRWFPGFAREVDKKKTSELYGSLARAASAFIIHDKDLVETILARFRSERTPRSDDSAAQETAR